jgi:hypothetical protein
MPTKATETKMNETSKEKADTTANEVMSKTVLLLERYCQSRMVAKTLPANTSYHGATGAISPIRIEEIVCPVDDNVGFWEAEALSYFRKSAWEGKLLGNISDGVSFMLSSVIYRSAEPAAHDVSFFV